MKLYNPFKMWGSYIGLVFLPLAYFIIWVYIGTNFKNIPISETFSLRDLLFYAENGFLFGWGIHSLIRRKNAK